MGAELEASEGRFPPLHRARRRICRASSTSCPCASAQVKSCVLIAGDVRRGLHDGRRGLAEPRPHRAHAAQGARALRARTACARRSGRSTSSSWTRSRVPGDPSSAAFIVAAATLVPGLARGGQGRGPQLDAHRLLPHRRAHGRGDPGRPRGARAPRRPRSRWASSTWPRAARGHGRRAGGGAAGDRRADAGGAARRVRGRARRSCAARASCASRSPTGSRPWWRGCAAWAPTSRRPRTASRCAATARRCAAARSTRAATTGSRCSAPWRGSPREEGVEVLDMEAAGVSYPGFELDLAALLG